VRWFRLVVGLSTGEMIEAAMVGKNGVVGASSALDGKVSLSRAIVQLGGPALVCEPGKLKQAALQSESLLSTIIRHEKTLYAQGMHKLSNRRPAWPLMICIRECVGGCCEQETWRALTPPLRTFSERPCADFSRDGPFWICKWPISAISEIPAPSVATLTGRSALSVPLTEHPAELGCPVDCGDYAPLWNRRDFWQAQKIIISDQGHHIEALERALAIAAHFTDGAGQFCTPKRGI
jgi:hypothetical protein